jgi:hypothetical protein
MEPVMLARLLDKDQDSSTEGQIGFDLKTTGQTSTDVDTIRVLQENLKQLLRHQGKNSFLSLSPSCGGQNHPEFSSLEEGKKDAQQIP